MYTSQAEKTGSKSERKMLFADVEPYTIPAKEGWNEGYSHTSKFLYITDTTASVQNDTSKNTWLLSSN